ncbi:MAG: hypothetical protein OEN22_02445 [Gammaproteobacteria bacterium]|nr:hypothetical protein [Gammaproteobacteria bacterium]
MLKVTASAPGKVLLCGEYAVLDGAPAICMAVDRRARATASPGDNTYHTVAAPGYSTARGRFRAGQGRIEWLEAGADFALVESVWLEANVAVPGTLALLLDTAGFIDVTTGRKIGIGSSAALAAALTALLHVVAETDADIARVAMAAHRRFQGGVGSGVDVACSLHGGVIEYRDDGNHPTSRDWPDGLAYALLWSGVPSCTGARLEKLADRKLQPSHAALGAAAERMAVCWASNSAAAILDEMRAYTDVLHSFSVDHDLGIFDAGHAELAAAAAGDVVYKPCGAGGGDVGLVLASSDEAIAAFLAAAPAGNFRRLDISLDRRGVQTVREVF